MRELRRVARNAVFPRNSQRFGIGNTAGIRDIRGGEQNTYRHRVWLHATTRV